MDSTCDEDQREVADVYCACKYPLRALCKEHAEKHLSSSEGAFHFTLPISARDVITSEEVYSRVTDWLGKLNHNFDLLRKKVQSFANGEEQIEAAYQDLLHLAKEENMRLQQECSAMKEAFRIEIEQAIAEIRLHALEPYEPKHVLAQMIWYKQPYELVSSQLFSFQAKCIQENLPSVFQIGLIFVPGLDHLDLGKCVPPLIAEIEALTQRLVSKEESVQTLSQQLEDAQAREARSQSELEDVTRKLQYTDNQLQTLTTENQVLFEHLKQIEDAENIKTQLEAQVQELKDRLQESEALCHQLIESQAEVELKNAVLEGRMRSWRITNEPPTESQESVPDNTTPQSRAALNKFGPYNMQDDELVLLKRGPVEFDEGVYIGQWNTRNLRHGYGKFLYTTGGLYEGQWRNGKKAGQGRYVFNDGIVYIGEFVQDKAQGMGTMFFPNGDEHSGTWINGKLEGFGSVKFGKSSQWSGDHYIGEFSEDLRNGHGAYFWSDGRVYAGTWMSGKQHGKGVETYADGQMYFGGWLNGLRSGTGSLLVSNGDVYSGRWQQGRKSGQGRLTHPGRVEEGKWIDDVLRR